MSLQVYLQAEEHEGFQARRDLPITLCWLQTGLHGGQGKTKERDSHSRLAEAGLTSKGTYNNLRLVLGTTRWADHVPMRILIAYRALMWSVTYTVQMVSSTHYSLKPASLKTVPTVGTVGGVYIPRTGKDWGASHFLGPSQGSTGDHVLSMTSSNTLRAQEDSPPTPPFDYFKYKETEG